MKRAQITIQVVKLYDITVEVPDGASQADAMDKAYEMQTTAIEAQGTLQDAGSDYAEFHGWVLRSNAAGG
jgi:hypothetical protein